MKHHDIFAIIRLIALLIVLATVACLCMTETSGQEQVEAAATTMADSEPAAPLATPEPIAEPEPKPESTETWNSLGTYTLTAYCSCEKCCGYWATIRPLDANGKPIVYTASGAVAAAGTTIAVDPKKIPYGTKVKINDHIYTAQDTGGVIKGNHIDVYHDDHQAALRFGRQQAEVFILEG